MDDRIAYRTCPLCEATCGLELTLRGEEIIRIRGDRDDVFSAGFICPKGSTLGRIEADPDLVRVPQLRDGASWREAGWDDAFALIEERLGTIIASHGPDAVAVYLGNPNVHNMSGLLYNRVFLRALRSKNRFTASTVDQMPKHVSSGLMFGHPDLIPVPDIDRTDYLLMLGANPLASNGSLATAPDWPGRLEAIRTRGGKVVVVDPRRSRTAAAADEHVFVRPGTDALLLFAIVHELFDRGLVDLDRLEPHVERLDEVATAAVPFSPERVAGACGIDAAVIRRIAGELGAARTAAVYGRIGTHTVRFGTIASWLVDVINALTGNLDRPGGAMFSTPAHERARPRRGWQTGRWHSRVHGHPEVRGEYPVAALADEILTPGDGQIRALITIAGNPILTTPDSGKLEAALASLEFMASIDLYRNETTGFADVILPAPSPVRRAHYDFAFTQLSVRNVANYSPPVLPLPPGRLDEWETLLTLAAIVSGQGRSIPIQAMDDFVFSQTVQSEITDPASPIHGRDVADITAQVDGGRGPERMLDLLVRTGPYGDRFGERPDGLSLRKLRAHPHGIDLGPLQPRIPEALATASGKVDLAPEPILADVPNLETTLEAGTNGKLLLVGRRHLRSNNSWMHNIEVLVKGKERCTLQIHPDDAGSRGIADGGTARISSRVGVVEAAAEVTEAVMPGVVSLPFGWGHDTAHAALGVAAGRPGVNSNRLTDGTVIDPLSGNAALNAIPVEVTAANGATA